MNQVILVGRIAKPIEIQEYDKHKVAYLTLAVQRLYKNKDNIYETDFIQVVLWNGIAENLQKFATVGDCIGIKGRIENDNYTDKDGNQKYGYQIIAEIANVVSRVNHDSKEE